MNSDVLSNLQFILGMASKRKPGRKLTIEIHLQANGMPIFLLKDGFQQQLVMTGEPDMIYGYLLALEQE